MDKKSFSFLSLGLLVGIVVSSTLFSFLVRESDDAASQKTILKLAHVLDPTHPVHLAMEKMAERLDEISAGKMEIQIFPSGQLGSETESIEQLQRGALAMVKTSAAAMEGFLPEMAVFGLPYLFRNNDHYWSALNGEVGKELLDSGLGIGIKGLCYYDSGSRSFYTVEKPILSPDDLDSLKIRVMKSKTAMDMISRMGGAPTPISWGELYTSLQQTMVDGAENNPPSYLSSRHYEVAKYYSLDEHTSIPDLVIFSKSIWDALTPQMQGWLEEAAADSVLFQRKLWQEKTEEAIVALKEKGVTIYNPDKEAFSEKVNPMYEALGDSPVAALAKRIKAIK